MMFEKIRDLKMDPTPYSKAVAMLVAGRDATTAASFDVHFVLRNRWRAESQTVCKHGTKTAIPL